MRDFRTQTISAERWTDKNIRILVAPNSFKECASSVSAAGVMVRELQQLGFENVRSLPLSDGGDGFLDVCVHHFGLQTLPFTIGNCYDGAPTSVTVGYSSASKTAYLEAADIIGLKLIPKEKRNPLVLESKNFGEFLQMMSQTEFGIDTLTIGIGGTGMTDLGLGVCGVFGLKLLDDHGNELEIIPRNYSIVHRIVLPERIHARINVVLDVECSLLGERGMTKIFAPQKGADTEAVELIETGVENVLSILKRDHGINMRYHTIGAGGGIALGLSLLTDVQVVTSRTFVLETLGLTTELQQCDVVITGEGSFDKQSLMNKAAGIVVGEARNQRIPSLLLVGSIDREIFADEQFVPLVFEMRTMFGSVQESMENFTTGISAGIKGYFKALSVVSSEGD